MSNAARVARLEGHLPNGCPEHRRTTAFQAVLWPGSDDEPVDIGPEICPICGEPIVVRLQWHEADGERFDAEHEEAPTV